jgi:transcriptional regulator with XRE-family HTH domain
MEATQKRDFYDSGFPKIVVRNKYDLPLNERLKKARNRLKMSSAGVVAELKKQGVNLSHSSLRGYEADEQSAIHRYPSMPIILALADFYGVSLDYLFGRSNNLKIDPKPLKQSQYRDLAVLLNSGESLTFGGEKLTPKQIELIQTCIGFALNRC